MAKEIKIFNPRDKPFGCLSNNYSNYNRGFKQSIPVIQNLNFGNGKACKTLTNYIYASLLQDGSRKQIVCNADPKEAKGQYHEQATNEKNDKILEAVKEALKYMFDQNTVLAELLLKTGNRDLFYIPKKTDLFLGINETDKQGDNLYGICLQQERKRLFREIKTQKTIKDKENEENIKYATYLAQKALTDAIEKGGDDLKKYIGLSLDQILKEFGGREKLESKFKLSKDLFLTSFQRRVPEQFDSYVLNPTNMVQLIRKQFLHELKRKKLIELKKQIFSMYADYLLEKNGVSREDFKKAKEEQFTGKDYFDNINNLEDRLYNLYDKGMLSERLSEEIDIVKKRYNIPSDEEINKAMKYEPLVKKAIDEQPYEYVSSNTDPIYILPSDATRNEMYTKNADYVLLSPDSVCKPPIKINGRTYLTVNHYIIEKLMLQLGVTNVYSSYILNPKGAFRNLPVIVKDYEELNSKFYKDKLIKYAKEGLKKKFDNRILQDYLLATGDANLIYNDREDFILGSGSKNEGDNEVGKYLMNLRTKFAQDRNKEEFNLLTPADIKLVMNDFMKDWVTQKVKDSCTTIVTINNYVKEKFDTTISVYPKFVEMILDNIYHPCSHIYGAVDNIKVPAPEYFVDIVRNCVGMESATSEIIDVLWKRIAVIIYYLIIHLGEKGAKIHDISSQIAKVQVLKSDPIKCENIVSDEYENCIIVALVNLIIGIINFNLVNSKKVTNVTEVEVEAAVSIILDSIITKKLPKQDAEEIVEGDKVPKDGKKVDENLTEYDLDEAIDDAIDEAIDDEDPLEFELSEEEKDIESEEGELGYVSEEFDNSDENSPHDKIDKIVNYLKGFPQIQSDDFQQLATYINEAVSIIKNETKLISEQIKRNRVNFFSSRK